MKIIQKLRDRPHGINLMTLLPENKDIEDEIPVVCYFLIMLLFYIYSYLMFLRKKVVLCSYLKF